MQQNTPMFGDKEMITDALSSQKFITSNYSTLSCECATPEIRNNFLTILNEEHQIQHDIFLEMQKRGWYQVQPAEAQKVTQAKTKFSAGS